MANGRGGRRGAGPGKKIGRPKGSKNKPRVYVVCGGDRRVTELIRLRVPRISLDRESNGARLGKGRLYRSAPIGSHEARALYRYLQEGLDGERFRRTNMGGKREPGPGKKIGRPPDSMKLLAMAAALAQRVPKSPEKAGAQVIASAAQATAVSDVP